MRVVTRLVHSGLDTLDVAFQGSLHQTALDALAAAQELAETDQEPSLIELGPGKLPMHVQSYGMRGGYAFVADTGPDGEQWGFKNNASPTEWNAFVSVRASALAVLGFHGARDQLVERLGAMGFQLTDHSVNRADLAMDFLVPSLTLDPHRFVVHARTKVIPYWGPKPDSNLPSAVLRGRRCESVTIGKMPGRQLIVYDKRRAAIEKQQRFWFTIWGIDPQDASQEVWRVEVRAGKKELKAKWQLRTFADVEDAFGDVCVKALDDIRYLAEAQTDSNISRQALHPIWLAAQEAASRGLAAHRCGLTRGQLRDILRNQAIEQHERLIRGNSGALSVLLDLKDDDIVDELLSRFEAMISDADGRPVDALVESRRRAARRLAFSSNRKPNPIRACFPLWWSF